MDVNVHGLGFRVESDEFVEVDRSVSVTVERVQQRFNLHLNRTSTRSHPEMVGDMSRVTLNFDLSKIPFLHS